MRRSFMSAVAVLALVAGARAEGAAGGEIKASDKGALAAAKDKDATVEGTVSEAAWSRSGKVMNIRFEGAEESGFVAVVFQKNKEAFDKAFEGDAAKALAGAKVKVTGRVGTYEEKPQIILNKPDQLKVVEKAKAEEKPAEQK